MKIRFLGILMWLLLFGFVLAGSLGLNLTKVKAQVLPTVPTVQFVTSASSGSEKIVNPEIDVNLSEITTNDVAIDYKITGGDATNKDYILSDGTLVILGGQLSNNIPLQIIDNKKFDSNKSIEITLSNPVNSSLGLMPTFTYTIIENNTPVTVLTKDPAAALGQNGFFTATPEITLSADRVATTYYQWDGYLSGGWSTYTNPLNALEGDHTLYYYSDDGNGFLETLQSETFKVETTPPVIPPVVPPVIVVPKVIVTPPPVLEDNSEPAEVIEIQPVVEKKIGTGVSTFVAQTAPEPVITPEVQGESKVIETPKDTESAPEESRNWNKLLLIISILIIAAGVATGGYYGYEWYMNRKDDGDGGDKSKNKSRW